MPTVTTVEFTSPHRNLRLVRRSAVEQILPTGGYAVTQPEVVYQFDHGRLIVEPEQDKLEDRILSPGNYTEQDAVEWLREHPDNGTKFFECVVQPTDPGPTFAAITDALLAGDTATLDAIGEQEFQTFNRPEIMDRVKGALDRLEDKE